MLQPLDTLMVVEDILLIYYGYFKIYLNHIMGNQIYKEIRFRWNTLVH